MRLGPNEPNLHRDNAAERLMRLVLSPFALFARFLAYFTRKPTERR